MWGAVPTGRDGVMAWSRIAADSAAGAAVAGTATCAAAAADRALVAAGPPHPEASSVTVIRDHDRHHASVE
jgi:hypothetical protein